MDHIGKCLEHGCRELNPRRLLSLSGWLLREIRGASMRKNLTLRIGDYLSGRCRGRLRLPRGLGESAMALSNLSRAQVRQVAYYLNSSLSGRLRLSETTSSFLHRVVPGRIWTDNNHRLLHGQLDVVKRLPSNCFPRNPRAQWPSTLDLPSVIDRTRKGLGIPHLEKVPLTVPYCLTRKAVSENLRLAGSIVSKQVVGIRASVEVPKKFLGHFRSSYGFLILTTRFKIPSGLIRFLLARWITSPTSLWLVEPCHFKTFLKRHVVSDFIRRYGPERPITDRKTLSRGLAGHSGDEPINDRLAPLHEMDFDLWSKLVSHLSQRR